MGPTATGNSGSLQQPRSSSCICCSSKAFCFPSPLEIPLPLAVAAAFALLWLWVRLCRLQWKFGDTPFGTSSSHLSLKAVIRADKTLIYKRTYADDDVDDADDDDDDANCTKSTTMTRTLTMAIFSHLHTYVRNLSLFPLA